MDQTTTVSRLLIFDIDGTLLELLPAEIDAYLKAFQVSFGITGVSDQWHDYRSPTDVGVAREVLERHFGRPCSRDELNRVLDAYLELLRHAITARGLLPQAVPGATAMLAAIAAERHVGLALASANLATAARLRLETAGIWTYFPSGGFAEDGDDKTRILQQCLARCRRRWPNIRDARDIIYVGDHPVDAMAARSCRVHFIGMATRSHRLRRLREIVADEIHEDYVDPDRFRSHVDRLWEQRIDDRQ